MSEVPYRLDIDADDFYDPAAGNTYSSWQVPFTGLNNYKYVSLLSASIPKSYYMIPSGYNTFTISNGLSSATISVEAGSYNYLTLRTALLASLNAAGFGAWTMTFTQSSSKYTFGNATANMIFTFANGSMSNILGFFDTTYTFSGGLLTSVRPINLQLTSVVVVESDLIKSRQDSSINQRILHSIPDTSPVAAPVAYQNGTPYETRQLMENTGQIFRISLFDADNRPLDPQHGSNFTLLFYTDGQTSQTVDAANVPVKKVSD